LNDDSRTAPRGVHRVRFKLVRLAEHDHIGRSCLVGERDLRARSADDQRAPTGVRVCTLVAGDEQHAVRPFQLVPGQRIGPPRLEAIPERDDRPFATAIQERDGLPRHRPTCRSVNPDTELG
jgi:hypothetical protein